MPRDLSDLLSEGAPRDPGTPDLGAIESRTTRRRAGRVGATVLVLAAAFAIGLQALPGTPERPIVDQPEQTVDGATVLPLPALGEVRPDHANGRPVFVVHDEAGEVRVLDAISPHDSLADAGKVLAYCQTSGWFVDPWHGAKFDANGNWTGGPAPYALARHQVLAIDDETVTVGPLGAAPIRGLHAAQEPRGADCGDTATPGGVQLDDLLVHHGVDDERTPGLIYPERPDDDCCGLLVRDQPQAPLTGDPVELEAPGAGEVLATHIGDRPVFVISHQDDAGGTQVVVLDAVDPHTSPFNRRVLTWCRETTPESATGVLFDPWYLSSFTPVPVAVRAEGLGGGLPAGGWTGGPAPTGLPRYAVLDVPVGSGATPTSVTVWPTPLPAVPRVDLGEWESEDDPGAVARANIPHDTCQGRDQLFPDMPPADPTLLDDLVLHEPLFPDRWWYPTPDRLLGAEPGLPPEALEQYLEMVAGDRVQLDLAELPELGDAGLAVQSVVGVELVSLDGRSLGLLRGAELVTGENRDAHGGAFLVRTADGSTHWVDPAQGTSSTDDGTTAEDRDASGTTAAGCRRTDRLGELTTLDVCESDEEASLLLKPFNGGQDARRYTVPRYTGQPDGAPATGRFVDAVFGGPGVVAQLSVECEVQTVIGFDEQGRPVHLFGGSSWDEPFVASNLLGSTMAFGDAPVPLVQVAAGPCSEPNEVEAGIWAIRADGPDHLNQVTEPAVLWTAP